MTTDSKFQKTAGLPRFTRNGGGGGHDMMAARAAVERPKNAWKTLKRLLSYIGKNRYSLFMLLLLMMVITSIDIIDPFLQQKAIDTITFQDGKFNVDFVRMRFYLSIIILIFLVSGSLTYLQGITSAKLSQDTIYILRKDLFTKISHLSVSYTDSHRHGDLMSRMTNDADNISNAISQSITILVSALLTLIGSFCMMLHYSPLLTFIAAVVIPLTIFISSALSKFMRKYFKTQQQLLGQLNGQIEEMVTEYRTVVAYGKEDEVVSDFTKTSERLKRCSIRARVWGSIVGPISNFLGNLQYVMIASAGGYMILNNTGAMTVGGIQAMLQYSKKFSRPVNMIANQYSVILTALAGAERIFDVLDCPDEPDSGSVPVDQSQITGDISFSHLCFGYQDRQPVIRDLSFRVMHGQKIAIVGATGSGKTTIVNLLERFYELDGGSISIDGKNITEIPKHDLRSMMAIVLQDTVLFHDTIMNNIRYGRDGSSEDEVYAAAHAAMADRFISQLKNGYDTVLSESGSNLSEGQRQLLAIARAVLSEPKILILDEATSSVDTRTEMHIQTAMQNLMKGRTSLIIAHRLSTIRDADQIIVIKDGGIAECGNHDELLAAKGEYYKLYQKQYAGVAI